MFLPNPNFIEELSEQDEFKQALADNAETARANAERFAVDAGAPWMPRSGAKSTVVVVEDEEGTFLVNTDHGGHLMEFGSVNNPPHAPLRRGALAAGLRVEEDPA